MGNALWIGREGQKGMVLNKERQALGLFPFLFL